MTHGRPPHLCVYNDPSFLFYRALLLLWFCRPHSRLSYRQILEDYTFGGLQLTCFVGVEMFSSSRPSQFIILVISLSLFAIGSQRRKFPSPDLRLEIGAIIKAPNVKLQEQQQQQQWTNSSWLKDCFKFNSKAWLHGPRVRNIQVPDELLIPMMQQSRQLYDHIIVDKLLGQTLCYPTGRFRNTSYSTMKSNESSSSQSNEWELRLFYLILHRHFHMNAFSEFRQRQACGLLKVPSPSLASSSQNHFDQVRPLPYDLGNFDYECPGSKFLVIVVSTRAGMGAVVKNGVVPSLFMAFATGRIPLFLQAVEGKGLPAVFTNRLPLASCDRGDWQCVFLPTSPCVLTLEDLRNATVLNENETRDLKKRAYLPSKLNETRVLVINLSDMKPFHARFAIHEKMRKKAFEVIQEILHHWNTTQAYETSAVQRDVLVAAAESMSVPYTSAEASQNRKLRMLRAGLFYALRPNPMARREIELQLHDALPNQTDASNRQFFGLPIRGRYQSFSCPLPLLL